MRRLLPAIALLAAAPAWAAPATRPAATRPAAAVEARRVVERAVEAHGGMEAWRRLGRGRFVIEMTRLDTGGRPAGPPTEMTVGFPTSGEAEIEGRMGGMTMRYVDGRTEVLDAEGRSVDDEAAHGRARFALPTWQYILSVPWKLLDAGARFEALPPRRAGGRSLDGVRVTYAPGVGDTPDDWYRFYVDPETGRLVEVLWIITAPGHDGTIEWCRFEDLREVEGVLLPHRWVFVPAAEDGTPTGPPMMEARLVGVSFENGVPATAPATRPAATRPATRPARRY